MRWHKTHIFMTRANQHIQKIIIYFDETLNHFGPMDVSENKEK